MLDFLKNIDINEKTIEQMDLLLDEPIKFNLQVNAENCLGIIIFMQKIGIKNVDELLINKPEWFLKTTKEMIKLLSNNKKLINQINEDYENVNL